MMGVTEIALWCQTPMMGCAVFQHCGKAGFDMSQETGQAETIAEGVT
jgi:hypothetical protein